MKRIIVFSVLVLSSLALAAQEVDFLLQARWGMFWLGQGTPTTASEGNSPNGVSSSQIAHHFGIGAHLSFSPALGIAPSIDVYTDEYVYLERYGRAVPTQTHTGSKTGNVANVLALGLNLPWLMSLPLGTDDVHFNLAAGLTLLFRIPVTPLDNTTDTTAIAESVLGEGKWLNVYAEPGIRIRLNDWFGFSLSVKTVLPVWHIWDSQDLPFHDNFHVGFVLGLILHL